MHTTRRLNTRATSMAIALATVVAAASLWFGPGRAASAEPPITNAPSSIRHVVPLFALSKTTTPTGPDMAATAHTYTADPDERASLIADGWQLDVTSTADCDGVVGYVYDRPASGSVALHRFYHPSFNTYYLTTLADPAVEVPNLETQFGFQHEGIVAHGFASTAGRDNAVALSYHHSSGTGERYHSIAGTPGPGFDQTAVIAYIVAAATSPSTPAAQLCPVSMLTQAGATTTLRYATNDLADRTAKLSAGWTADTTDVPAAQSGMIGYLWNREVPGTVAVHRLFHPTFQSYYYEAITDPGRLTALAGFGFVDDGTVGYGFATPQPQTVPLDFYLDGTEAYYATTSAGDAWAAQNGFVWQASTAHVFTSADPAVPYYEVLPPTSGPSKGVMLTIHGGSWFGGVHVWETTNALGLGATRGNWMATGYPAERDRYRALGWTVYNVDYHSGGARALDDLQSFYDELRALMPSAKICTSGGSAGGHLALMLATRNHDIACAISLAGPTNLSTGAAFDLITAAFGPQGDGTTWDDNSPALNVDGFATETLLATAAGDTLVPPSQAEAFADALDLVPGAPSTTPLELDAGQPAYLGCLPGSTHFIHACVTDAEFARYLAAEAAFLNGI